MAFGAFDGRLWCYVGIASGETEPAATPALVVQQSIIATRV